MKKTKLEMPVGVSQWKSHGEQYGYWQYFEKKMRAEVVDKIEEIVEKNENATILDIYLYFLKLSSE